MDNLLIIILSVVGLLIAVIIALYFYFMRIIRIKNQGIIRQINERDRLMKELEAIHTEKKVMKKMLNAKIEGVLLISGAEKKET